MNNDIQCPYCHEGNNINHDDGCGYEENEIHSQECNSCNKVFAFTTSVSFSYEANKADCLNDADHQWKETKTYPARYTKLECFACGERKPLSKERLAELINEAN